MEMMGVVGSSVDVGSVLPPLVSGTLADRGESLLAADASKCSSWSCSYDISGLKKRYAVDKINCRQMPIRLPSRNHWWVVIPLLSA